MQGSDARYSATLLGLYTMRLRRIALWFFGGCLLLLVAGFCWLWFGNIGVFKPQLEQLVFEKTGRELVIDGRFDVDLGRETVIIAEGIRFENADWSEHRQMFEVGYLEVRVDTFSLFGAPLTIELVEVDDVEIRLEQPESGEPNWLMFPPAEAAETEAVDDGSVLDVIVGMIDADAVRIVYESPERTGPLDLRIASLRQQHRDDDFLELTLDGELNERTFDIRAVTGTWRALLAEQNVEYELEGQLDTFSLSSKGTIDDLVAPNRPSLTFAASGPDINDLLRLLRIGEGGKGDIELTGSLKPVADGPLVLDVEGRLGQLTLDASGAVSDLQSLEQFDATMRASSPDLSRILALFGIQGVREAPFMLELDASRQGSILDIERARLEFAGAEFDLDARLPAFPGLDDGDARFRVTGSDFARLRELLQLPGAAEGPFSLGLELESDEQGEEILSIALTSTLATVEAQGRVVHGVDYAGSELDFTLDSDSLARFGTAYGLPRLPELPMKVRGSFVVEEDAIRVSGPLLADIDGTRLQVEGVIALAPRLAGSYLSVGIATPDLAQLVGMFAPSEQVPPLPSPSTLMDPARTRGGSINPPPITRATSALIFFAPAASHHRFAALADHLRRSLFRRGNRLFFLPELLFGRLARPEIGFQGFQVLHGQRAGSLFQPHRIKDVIVAGAVVAHDVVVQEELLVEHLDDRARADLETRLGGFQRSAARLHCLAQRLHATDVRFDGQERIARDALGLPRDSLQSLP